MIPPKQQPIPKPKPFPTPNSSGPVFGGGVSDDNTMSSSTTENTTTPATTTAAATGIDLVLEDVTLASPATLVAGPAYTVKFRNQGTRPAGKFQVAIIAGFNEKSKPSANMR